MLQRIRTIADYQFGKSAGVMIFPDDSRFIASRRGEVRQVLLGKERLCTLRAHDGRLTLGLAGAKRYHDSFSYPKARVSVQDDAVPFVSAGKSVFSRHIMFADPELMAGDEVLIVDSDDNLIAVGSAMLCGREMMAFSTGMAVSVRKGILQKS